MNIKAHNLALALFAILFLSTPLQAQNYPVKPVRFLVGYPPGGGTDILARVVAQKLTESFGQQVLVDNRPGANSNIAAGIAAKAPPDGYLMFMISAGLAINQAFDSTLNFDLEKDFLPIAAIGTVPHVIAVHPSVPVKSISDLIALAKARPGQVSYGSSGIASPEHIAAAMFSSAAKISLLHIPYKGGSALALGVVGGEAAISFNGLPPALPFIKSGRMRCLAVTTERRAAALPDIPTVAEAGLPGYAVSVWYGAVAPTGTSREIIARLNSEINKILNLPEVRERLITLGAEPTGGMPEAFGAHIKSDVAKIRKIVKDANIKPE